ncbi:Ppx/GppA phosphatase family protein [Pedobacter sp. GR22-6]|uniref:Ppx/GppA phosphatase family protein n=1 Tax=Pedobacter sp. GR22-6 TaxID=3127957 RepID=UPI00307EEB72
MKVAVIDLGTNTFHLIIAEISPEKKLNIIYKTNEPVRLGQSSINENIIIPEAFERGINTLKKFRQEIDKHEISVIRAIATSAVRSARNGADFVSSAKEEAGIDITVINGDQEAEYIYEGVCASGAIKGSSLIMDIGGGSTEFILCNQHMSIWKKSYDIGAARLMQAFFHSDPLNNEDKKAIINHLNESIDELKTACSIYKPTHLIGSAGAFETFAGLILKGQNVKEMKSVEIPIDEYRILSEQLIASTHEEREQIPDLIKLRVDMIVIAAILTDYVIKNCGIRELSLSTYDLKMGVLQCLKRR